jgi:hypothetical protein
MEVDPGLVKQYVDSQGHWPKGPYVQKPELMVNEAARHCASNRELLHGMLDKFFG